MRVLVASTFVPFIEGGGRMIVRDLVSALEQRGHEVDTIETPFLSTWDTMLEQMLALRMIDVADSAEILIAIRTPSYVLRHPNKRLWFIHHHRGAYDLWGTPYQDIPSTPEGLAVRDALIAADNLYLREARRICTNSQIVSSRLREYNDLDSTVLYPPLGTPERFVHAPAEDYVFYPCRITGHKRQQLAVEAAAHLRSGARVVIAGAADSPEQLEPLQRLISEHRLQDQVELIPHWISEQQKADLIARSAGVLYIPFLEDSYGYVSLEAFHAQKPVITCTDSGGTLELIEDGVNGLICEPTPVALAAAIDRLHSKPADTARMGQEASATLQRKQIDWDNVVATLLA
jgi:glycosyltransferase involved in cell wall biosynthesis